MPGGDRRAALRPWLSRQEPIIAQASSSTARASEQILTPDRLAPLLTLDTYAARARLAELHGPLSNNLARPLTRTLIAAWAAGEHAATIALGSVGKSAQTQDYWLSLEASIGLDWTEWDSADLDAAGIVRGDGLKALLSDVIGQPWNEAWQARASDRGSLLASITDNRLDQAADALAANLEAGGSVDTLAKTLADVLDTDTWAELVATTETARAMTAASLATYAANQVPGKSFLSAEDGRVCSLCSSNEAAGPIPVGQSFPYGDPPTHPSCRCVLLPEQLADTSLPAADLDPAPLDLSVTEETP